mmetsp:Transcript_20154/g.30244  ORF Transcript_20154/g.30244 Transcript_20154/m.30244 type:complete len:124 (-) Transcript_20154:1217-1588(-)
MQIAPFQFEQSQFIKCAVQSINQWTTSSRSQSTDPTFANTETETILIEECHDLFQQHQSFYHRSSSHSNDVGRLDQFVKCVMFVYRHNQKKKNEEDTDNNNNNNNTPNKLSPNRIKNPAKNRF